MLLRIATIVVLIVACPASATAILLTATFEGTVSGTIGGSPFTSEPFVLTATGDTADRVAFSAGLDFGFDLALETAVIALPNLNGGTTLAITSDTFLRVNNSNSTMGFTDDNFVSGIFLADSEFNTYDLGSSVDEITAAGVSSELALFNTDGGDFVFADGSPTLMFTAVAVPEASAFLFMGIVTAVTLARRRRDREQQSA